MDMIADILATAASADPLISGDWLLKLIAAFFSGLAGLGVGRIWGRKESAAQQDVTLKKPVPTIQTREEPAWATKPDLDDHIGWTRNEFTRVWGQFGTERTIDNDELNKIHDRINQQSLATASLKGSVEEIGKNVTQLLHLSLHGKTPPRQR
jgi:hypothetical protein